MKETIFSKTEQVLLTVNNFTSAEGKLLRNKVLEASEKMDSELLSALISDDETRGAYFTDVDGILVFDKQKFSWIIQNKSFLPDSYTRYKNKIGLMNSKGEFIAHSHDVELVFPHKDCILEGGQTKEDQRKDEVFYNELLSPDQITTLLAPKAFCNAKRYDKSGCHEVTEITDEDNLIIKGNNLLALSSLLERYRGQVKCIYIDPPYNTGKDEFKYNDKFNHSSWLSFMKTRLELSKKLLRNNGSIFVHLDYHESHYAKILLDEIFGKDCFRNNIVWCYTGPSGSNNFLPRKHDDILYYAKTKDNDFHVQFIHHKSGVHNSGQVFGSTDVDDSFKEKAESQGKKLEDFWVDIYSTDRYRSEMLDFIGQKPEALLERIINISTNPNDLVLDFHLGSGTTAAVAHKMGRRYIGVEQLDYGENDSVVRLQNVINGDTTGISKSAHWQGGGSFVYCELAKLNQSYVERIQCCKTDDEIKMLTDEILKSDFVSSKVKPSDINTSAADYNELSFDEKQQFAMELLDKNLLYVNYSERHDPDMKLTESDIAFSESFYGDKA